MKSFTKFAGIPSRHSRRGPAKFIVLPLPYEKTTTYVKGTAKGPQAILDASYQVEPYDEELQTEIYKTGIYTIPLKKVRSRLNFKARPEKFVPALKKYAQSLIRPDKLLVSLGGEHTITIGLVQAHKKHYPNLSVLQLDAHSDLWSESGTPHHASVARRILEICPVVQVGIRCLAREHSRLIKQKQTIKTFYAHKMQDSMKQTIKQVLKCLKGNIYVTIDVDVFDPAYMPAVGTPEPGGLTWYEVLDILRPVFKTKRVVGFDLVELCPQKDSIISDFTAAKLAYRLMGYLRAC